MEIFMLILTVIGALACLTVKGFCGKKLSGYVKSGRDPYFFNFLRLVFCIVIGIAIVFMEGAAGQLAVEFKMLAISFLSGISNAAFLVCWMLAVRRNSLVSVDVGLTLGSLIPSILCLILFGEEFSIPKMIGFLCIVIATVILSGGEEEKKKSGALGLILLFLAAVGDGMSGFAQQLYKHFYTEGGARVGEVVYSKSVFHFYTYVFAAAALLIALIVYYIVSRRSGAKSGEAAPVRIIPNAPPIAFLHISVMAITLFLANYLQTVATNDLGLSSQILYPIIKGGCLVTVTVIAMLFFGEKITKRSILGSLVAILGIVIMSVL